MLVIRLTRIGKTNEVAYRVVVAEKRKAVKGASMEIVGFYNPSEMKKGEFKKERIAYWISKGATPSDTVASLLKQNGVAGMEKFIAPRNLKRKIKNPTEAQLAAMAPAKEEAPAKAEEPAAEPVVEAPAEVEAPVEAPAEAEAPQA